MTIYAGTGATGYSGDGGPPTSATFNNPFGIAAGPSGEIYVADTYNHVIRKIPWNGGTISTVAGNGTAGFSGDGGLATSASLSFPSDIYFNVAGNLFIADELNHRIRMVTPAGVITTIAGNGTSGYSGDGGPAVSAILSQPSDVFATASGGGLFYR